VKIFFKHFVPFTIISSPAITAAESQQDSNPKHNRDKYTLDIETARKTIRGTQRWQDTHQTLNGLVISIVTNIFFNECWALRF
jgi:hypothetical protein